MSRVLQRGLALTELQGRAAERYLNVVQTPPIDIIYAAILLSCTSPFSSCETTARYSVLQCLEAEHFVCRKTRLNRTFLSDLLPFILCALSLIDCALISYCPFLNTGFVSSHSCKLTRRLQHDINPCPCA